MKALTTKNIRICGAAFLMGLTFTLSGCGSDKTENPKDDKLAEKQPEEQESDVTLKKMSEEETKTLKEGQFIDKINDKTLKMPDEETLEKMGLCYEVEVNDYSWLDGDEKKPTQAKAYIENANLLSLKTDYYVDNDVRTNFRIDLVGIRIVPITAAYTDKIFKDARKEVQFTDGPRTFQLINSDNLNDLQILISDKYGYIQDQEKENILINSKL